MLFYTIRHNTFSTRGFPWISTIIEGLSRSTNCPTCGGIDRYPVGDIKVSLELNKGTKWPDVLGCGAEPLLIVSDRTIRAWRNEKVGEFPMHRVRIIQPYPKKLEGLDPPDYYWIDGKKMRGALLDFEMSGFVDVKFCSLCRNRTDNITTTYRLQNSKVCPFVFRPNSWHGANLFTTDLSDASFFCTDVLVACATKHSLTNFRFIPVEEGTAAGSKGLRY